MFGLGPMELIIVFLIVVILFGAKKLPQIGDGMGKAITNFKHSVSSEKRRNLDPAPSEIIGPPGNKS